jgi:dipeptidyl-peptidase 4
VIRSVGTSAHTAELSIERLFDAPALSGPTILGLQLSPDGSRVTYLKEKDGQKDRLDLWEYGINDGQHRLLVDSDLISSHEETLSDEEAGRRERQRTAALSGILEYSFAPCGDALLFPIAGKLFYLALNDAPIAAREVAAGASPVTDASVSPDGAHVAYVRDQNLFLFDLVAGQEVQLTHDGGNAIKNGMAEFIAQEEMDRSQGYWWAPDGSHIAFARIDESPVEVTQRFEIAADNVTTYLQRYPAAGQANVLVSVGVISIHSREITWIDFGAETDVYLARVDWLPDGKSIALQREARSQRRLDLIFSDISTGQSRNILSETSETWVDLHHELSFLKGSREFVWQSARSGYQHLYLYSNEGRLIRPLTYGEWNVDDFRHRAIKAIDEASRLIYFTATEKSPTERHLYRTSLDTETPAQVSRVTQDAGLHTVIMSSDARVYVDSFNSNSQPTCVSLFASDGTLKAALLPNRLDATHPDAPYLAENSVGEIGTLAASDGQLLYYRIYKPAHFDPAKRYPAIVDVYGGPGVQRVLDNWSGSSFTQILTRAGYVVFQLDNRGTAHRGTRFQAPIHGRLGEIEVIDQCTGARWLASRSYVDPTRIGVWGWSYGGYMTLMMMFKAPEVFRAGVSGAPVTDWLIYDTHYTERYLGKPQDNTTGYAVSSVLSYADKLRGNLLLIHGMADDNVLFLNSTKLYRHLQDLGKPFEIMLYPGAKHGLIRQNDGRHAYQTILKFFDRTLAR